MAHVVPDLVNSTVNGHYRTSGSHDKTCSLKIFYLPLKDEKMYSTITVS